MSVDPGWNTNDIKKYRNYTRVVAVLDVALATLGFFFNPFNDEEAEVPFLYWKITITCFMFEIWMIVSINLFVATQKSEDPSKSVKYCNYWLVIATGSFVGFQALVVFPSCFQLQPITLYQLFCPTGIFIYRLVATAQVIKYRIKLIQYCNTYCSQLQENLNQSFPDLLASDLGQCHCSRSSTSPSMMKLDMNLHLNPNSSVHSLNNNNNNNINYTTRRQQLQLRNDEIRDERPGHENEQFLRIVQV